MSDQALRDHIKKMIADQDAHVDFEKAVADFPEDKRGARPEGARHSAWEILEHMRIAQSDILEFSRNPNHESPEWPDGYWPKEEFPPDDAAWQYGIDTFLHDRNEMQELVANESVDLFAKIPHGTGQTVLREAIVVAKHNSYHTGELVLLRRMLGAWGQEQKG